MSLIDEALKRARMEAAKKGAEEQGLPYPAIPRHLGSPAHRPGWLAVAAVAIAIGLGIAAGLFLAGSRRPAGRPAEARLAAPDQQTPSPETSAPAAGQPGAEAEELERPTASEPEAVPPAPQTASPVPPAATARSPVPASRQPLPTAAEPRPAAPVPTPTEPEPRARPAGPAPSTTAVSQQSDMAVPDPEPALAPAQSPEAGVAAPAGNAAPPEAYVGRFESPSGATIELGGIAWSETEPYALINGQVLGPGGSIDGFTVAAIGPRHVDLRGAGRLVRISLD